MFHLRFLFPYWFSVLLICPLDVSGLVKFLQLLCCYQFLILCLLVFALGIEVLLCWVHGYFQLLCLFLGLSFDHYVVSLLISCNILYFRIYFVWNKNCHSSFLLIFICMEYLFLSFNFQSVHVFRPEVGPL